MSATPSWVFTAIQATVAAVAFAAGVSAAPAELGALWKRPRLLLKALLAVLVLVPVIAVLLVKAVQPPNAVAGGLLIAALSIGPVAALKRSRQTDPARDVALGLNIVLLLLSVVYVPFAVWLVGLVFERELHLSPGAVANTILPLQLVPLFVGLAVGRLAPRFVARLVKPLTRITNLALGIVAVAVVVVLFDQLVGLGARAWILIATFAAMAMLVGHALGGPEPGTRTVVATFSALRFPGLGLVIAQLAADSRAVLPVMLGYVLCSVGLVAIYLAVERAQQREEPPASERKKVEPHAPPHGA
jgi:BASS family bile acid:Na+ symporter